MTLMVYADPHPWLGPQLVTYGILCNKSEGCSIDSYKGSRKEGYLGGDFTDRDDFEPALVAVLNVGYRLAYGMLQDRYNAEDAVQQAALNAWNKRHQCRPGRPFKPWFLAIVANECRTIRRSHWWSLMRGEIPVIATASLSEDDVVDQVALRQAIRRLRHRDRLAVILRFYLDLPFEEVGAAMGISSLAARTRIHRLMRGLESDLRTEEAYT